MIATIEWCKRIREVLEDTTYENTLTINEIADLIEFYEGDHTKPRLRKLIMETMKLFNFPIGSYHKGFYKIRSGQEMQRYLNRLLQIQVGISERIETVYEAYHGRY